METKEWRNKNRSADWPPGEWDSEPDKLQWPDPATGLACLIVRNFSGALCGYVGVPRGHPAYELEYNSVAAQTPHGGLTFSDRGQPHTVEDEASRVCHTPAPGESDDVWWFGFDCAHSGDFAPGMAKFYESISFHWGGSRAAYRNIEYVRGECTKLAQELAV